MASPLQGARRQQLHRLDRVRLTRPALANPIKQGVGLEFPVDAHVHVSHPPLDQAMGREQLALVVPAYHSVTALRLAEGCVNLDPLKLGVGLKRTSLQIILGASHRPRGPDLLIVQASLLGLERGGHVHDADIQDHAEGGDVLMRAQDRRALRESEGPKQPLRDPDRPCVSARLKLRIRREGGHLPRRGDEPICHRPDAQRLEHAEQLERRVRDGALGLSNLSQQPQEHPTPPGLIDPAHEDLALAREVLRDVPRE